MRILKQTAVMLLSLAVIFAALPISGAITVNAAETEGYYTYTVSNGEATITDCDTSISGDIVIPDTLGGYPVTSIGYSTFSDCTSLASVTIPDSVASIGDYAFYNCTSLTSINIPDSVASIGDDAFVKCTGLTSIFVDENNCAYSSSEGILFNKDKTTLICYPCGKIDTAYTIPDSVTSIGDGAFNGCTSLTSITIPDSVTSIGYVMFGGCISLTNITIPDSVTSIDDWAFGGCTSLTSITIPDSVTSIGDYAFCDCTSLTSITIPNGVTSIGDYAFWGCTSLMSINIPDSVTSLGYYMFDGCTSLTSITIPDSVTSIDDWAFGDCTSLQTVYTPYGSYAYYWALDNGFKVVTNGYVSKGIYKDFVWEIDKESFKLSVSGSGVMPDFATDYTAVPWYGYKDKVTSIELSGDITAVGAYTFSGMTALKTVVLPESVIKLGEGVFYGCVNLQTVNIPAGVAEIPQKAFYNCRKLNGIDHSGFISIGEYAFYRCSSLEEAVFTNAVFIDNFAFNKCTALSSVTFGKKLAYIGECAFADCSALTYAAIPETINYTDETAFDGCDGIVIEYYTPVSGDLDGDGALSANDLTAMRKALLNGTESADTDINGDGTTDIKDLIALKKALAESTPPTAEEWQTYVFSENTLYQITLDFDESFITIGFGDDISQFSEEEQQALMNDKEYIYSYEGIIYYFGRGDGFEISCENISETSVTVTAENGSRFTVSLTDENTLTVTDADETAINTLHLTVGTTFNKTES